MDRAELIELTAEKVISGNRDTTAANVRELLNELINSCVNLEQDADNNGGFPLIASGKIDSSLILSDVNGGFPLISGNKISDSLIVFENITSDDNMSMLPQYRGFIATVTLAGKIWQSPLVGQNKIYEIVNIGSATLKVDYPTVANNIIDLANSLTPENTIYIASGTGKTIIDNGTYLIYK